MASLSEVMAAKGIPQLTDEDLQGLNPEDIRCRNCSGYGNCGYKKYSIYKEKALSICQLRKKKCECARDGIEWDPDTMMP